jgi:ABC-type dipeptide/oligopeptide/nickel transport system permease subunit
MPTLNMISELMTHMPCPQLLLCIVLYYFGSLGITLCCLVLSALWTLWVLHLGASKTCILRSLYVVLELE